MIERIGIVGGGQLGRMLTEAALPLGFHVTVLEEAPDCPAVQAGAQQIVGGIRDPEAITVLAEQTDVVTWEIEHVDADTLVELADQGHNIQPSPRMLQTIKDKFAQKQMLEAASIPVAQSVALDQYTGKSKKEILAEVKAALGDGVILKKRHGSYDGRGNYVLKGEPQDVDEALTTDWDGLYAERMVPFDRELAVVAARDTKGSIRVYPAVETIHQDNICHIVMAPADIPPKLRTQAEDLADETLTQLDGAGVFGIEMFAVGNDVMINEIAPRVHNSGHGTIEGNITSQFEQHIRAISGMPLGSVALRAPAVVMINILGQRTEAMHRTGLQDVLAHPDAHVHFYGKDPKPGRKIGHITILGSSLDELTRLAQRAREDLKV